MPEPRRRKWYLEPEVTAILCPECGSRARRGRVSGWFRFAPDQAELQALLRELRRRGHRGVIDPRSLDPHWTFGPVDSVSMEAKARCCSRCHWMDIDCASVVLRRRRGREIVVNRPRRDECPSCPECGGKLRGGYARSTLVFEAEGERLGGARRWLRWWLGGTGARAPAACCNACGWIGIDCAGLVEPAPPAPFDRIEHH